MPFRQSIDTALDDKIGREGLSRAALDAALKRSEGGLRWLRLPAATDDLEAVMAASARLRADATDVVFLGTGGSSLGGQTLAQLSGHAVPGVGAFRPAPRLHFLDNLDAESFEKMLAALPLKTTRFVAISKSGGTAETLMQTIAALSAVKAAGLSDRIPGLFLGLTEPAKDGKRNGLRDLLTEYKISMLEHHTGIGGRHRIIRQPKHLDQLRREVLARPINHRG